MLESIINRANERDILIVIITSLAIVGFWRGTWNLMDKYLFPENFIASQLTSITFGLVILFIIGVIKLGKSNKK